LIPTSDAASTHEIIASLNKPQNKYSAELVISLVHPFFTIRSWWAVALVAWQPFNASSDKCTAVHTRILVNDIYRLMSVDIIVMICKQFHYFSEIYLKKFSIENNRFD
jgi:hypothetical protein